MAWLAFDIGGANIKLADGRGFARSQPLALWKRQADLAGQLRDLIAQAPASRRLAITMTGELADCFVDKAYGVRFIVRAVCEAAGTRPALFYCTDGSFIEPQGAAAQPRQTAASNWHALARYAARFVPPHGHSLVLDVGSTTCDIVPLRDRGVAARGITDTERLLAGELVYTGVERTPVCSILATVPYRGRHCPIAREQFATALDAYLLLGLAAENPQNTNTADGQPATKPAARARLGRMISAWEDEFNEEDACAMAKAVQGAQVQSIAAAMRSVLGRWKGRPAAVVVSGQGELLGRQAVDQFVPSDSIVALSERLGPEVSRAGPAHALAVLAREAYRE